MSETILGVTGLTKHYPGRGGGSPVRSLDGVSFELKAGETLGIVGESGCGKSTLARCIVRLTEPTGGQVVYRGTDVTAANPSALRQSRRKLQIVLQDPYSSLNPRMRVRQIITEPWRIFPDLVPREQFDDRLFELLRQVGLSAQDAEKFPHQFSGGQRQRIGIARALALNPEIMVCDEPVSALDVSVQAQVIELLRDIQRALGLSYLFIAHDLSVVRHISHRIGVMYLGQLVEIGPAEALFNRPAHPYTKALLSAIPDIDAGPEASKDRIYLVGELPSPQSPPSGCRFRTRCWRAEPRCQEEPSLAAVPGSSDHQVSCHFPLDADYAETKIR
ncbi:MAG: ATP-binding cassette domain-containing protein [Pararhodobacter sp.]|nr:ATP-binding cassette domain-containing protein [Pararhodobacter sp.]